MNDTCEGTAKATILSPPVSSALVARTDSLVSATAIACCTTSSTSVHYFLISKRKKLNNKNPFSHICNSTKVWVTRRIDGELVVLFTHAKRSRIWNVRYKS